MVAAFVAVFVGTLVLTTLLSALVTKFVKVSVLQSLDRWLGALFGLLRGLVIVVALRDGRRPDAAAALAGLEGVGDRLFAGPDGDPAQALAAAGTRESLEI